LIRPENGAGKGIRAIVVYPMNARANSQCEELSKFLKYGYPDGKGPVTFERYTGRKTTRSARRSSPTAGHPPDQLHDARAAS